MRTDAERGLILVKGAVPGDDGGFVQVRDAVKKKLPKKGAASRRFVQAKGA